MKRFSLGFILLPILVMGYELGMINTPVPSPLEKLSAEFFFDHRFRGNVTDDPLGTLLGLYQGANAFIGLKFTPVKGLEMSISRKSRQKEWMVGASYSHRFPAAYIRGRVGIDFFSYDDPGEEQRAMNFFYQMGLQSESILKRIKPSLTLAYDGYNQHLGLGTGLSVKLFEYVWYFEEINLLAEYYPVFGRSVDKPWLEESNAWVAGVGASTSGHHFVLSFGNTWDLGTRRLMLGVDETTAEGLYIGIGIKRVLKF